MLFKGILLNSIWFFWFFLGMKKRFIALMEQYKKEGESVDAKVVQKIPKLLPFRFVMDDVRNYLRNQVVVEYSTGDATRIRKKLVVSGGTTQQAQETLRVLVLPGYPKSAHAQTQVDYIILNRCRLLVIMHVIVFIFLFLYLRGAVKFLSIVNGPDNKRVGWILFWLNFLWTPALPYLFVKFVERKRWNECLYQGEEISQEAAPLLQA
jgi:hypothetical protein